MNLWFIELHAKLKTGIQEFNIRLIYLRLPLTLIDGLFYAPEYPRTVHDRPKHKQTTTTTKNVKLTHTRLL